MIEVFSSGGGTQSTAIAALIVQGKLPKPDIVVIADTGRECAATWKYLDAIVEPALLGVGIQVQKVGHDWYKGRPDGKDWHEGETLLVGAWSDQTGNVGKLGGFCSGRWKVRPIDRYLSRQHSITRKQYIKWIGFSMDEWRRAQRIMVTDDGKNGLVRLPLCKDFPLTRQQAISIVESMGWPTPPRSRCWMCPNQTDDQWSELKQNYPDEFQKAIDFEKEIQEFDPYAWLHKSCIPLDKVDFSKEPTLFDSGLYCNSGVCFV